MIKNRNETSAAMDKALKNLEQAVDCQVKLTHFYV